MNSPKVSIVVPVYNVEHYLNKCLDTIVNQTYTNIEIICVNDGSTDNSLNILKAYAEKDSRIIIIDCEKNSGLLVARKKGVEVSKGEYLIFVDSDDYIDLNLCQFIFDITEKEDADIIHFSSGVDIESTEIDVTEHTEALKPFTGTLQGKEIIDNAYNKRNYATQMWGKIYKTGLCKKVYALLPDEHCYVGEDVFTYFFLSYYADKYLGVETPHYYYYRYGLGISGLSHITLHKFEMFCKMSNWIKFINNHFKDKLDNQTIITACNNIKIRLFNDCCEIYRNRIKAKDKFDASVLIYKYWSNLNLDDKLWENNINQQPTYLNIQNGIKEYIVDNSIPKDVMPDVSIIIYAYNCECVIGRTIDSILSQTMRNIEIIVVNDGSTDNTFEILEKYLQKDYRITFINQKNRGKGIAYNKALKVAKSGHVYFADMNTVLKEDAIEKMYKKASDNDFDIVYSGYDFNIFNNVSDKEKIALFVKNGLYCGDLSSQLINRNRLLSDREYKFDELLFKCDYLFSDLILSKAKSVGALNYMICEDTVSDKSDFTSDINGFIESFKIYSILSSNAIVKTDEEINKELLTELSKKYYDVCKKIYMNLSKEEQNMINIKLESEYKPFLFSLRELKNIKSSLAYRISNNLVVLLSKIIK